MNDPQPPTPRDIALTAAPPGWRAWHAEIDPDDPAVPVAVYWEPLIGWLLDSDGRITPQTYDTSSEENDPRLDPTFLAITGPGQRLRQALIAAVIRWQFCNQSDVDPTAATLAADMDVQLADWVSRS